jgi:hypothetical protein
MAHSPRLFIARGRLAGGGCQAAKVIYPVEALRID